MNFWYAPCHPLGLLLAPLGWVYGAGAALHGMLRARNPYYASVPVISIGNLTVGGTGKTTLVEALARHFATKGKHRVAIVSRGYGGCIRMPTRVDTRLHHAAEVGDEPLALATALQPVAVDVWVGRHRPSAVKRAEASGATLILLDDGFQRRDVARTADIITMDAARALGNGRCLPAGPLREKVSALSRVTFAVQISEDNHPIPPTWQGVQSYRLGLATPLPAQLKGQTLVAFAGLARPDKFFNALQTSGAKLAATVPFPDHHRYTLNDLTHLHALATQHNATLVATPKDAPKLPQGFAHILAPKLTGEDWPEILARLEEALKQ